MTPTYDPVWDEHYAGGAGCRYPWDSVVTFVFRHRPQDKQANDTKLLEVGCGLGSNLQFAATEGFQVSGLDASDDAIRRATSIFKQEGLSANLKVGNFTSLPFENKAFDMVIDRAALTCCGQSALALAIEEIYRVLKPGGKFFFTPYSQDHTSYRAGSAGDDGVVININGGSLVGVGQLCRSIVQ